MQPRRKTRRKQAGFSVIEVLLVIFVIAALFVTGLVIYQHRKPGNAKTSATTSATQTTQSTQTTTQYFTINEWGVKAPYSGRLKLSYAMSSDNRTATFSSNQLAALSSDCVGYGGAIVRYLPTDYASVYQQGPMVEQVATQNSSLYKHIGSYYYIFRHVQSGCGDITSTAALQSQTNDAVKALVPNLQAIASTQNATQYLDIKEWGVKVKLDDADKLTYTMNGTPNGTSANADGIVSYAALSLKDSITTSPKCKPLTTSISQHLAAGNTGEGANMTTVGNYAYGIDGGPNSCDDTAINALQQKIFSELLKRNIVAD